MGVDIRRIDVESAPTGASAIEMQGTAAAGAPVAGDPVQIGGKDGSGNAQPIATDTDGHLQVDVASSTSSTRTEKFISASSQTVTTPGTGVAIRGVSTEVIWFTVVAKKTGGDNTGVVYFGDSEVDNTATQEIPLSPGDSFSFTAPEGAKVNLTNWYIDADNSGDGVTFVYLLA